MDALSIDGAQLRYQLGMIARQLRKLKPHERALLGFDGASLTIEARDTVCFVQAVGTWTGTARAPATLVAALAACPPVGDRIEVVYDGRHLRLGPLKVEADWVPISTTLQRALPAADWVQGIALRYSKPRGQLMREGLVPTVTAAERKLAQLVRRTARSLAPTGVSEDDVRELVECRLAERFTGTCGSKEEDGNPFR